MAGPDRYLSPMDNDQIGQLVYLGLLGAALAGGLIIHGRARWGELARAAASWVLIFLGVIAVVGLWDDIRSTVAPFQQVDAVEGRIDISRSPDGHYYLQADVNGAPILFVVDTGATDLVLSTQDAIAAGLDPDTLRFGTSAMTANGRVRTARVTLDSLSVGEIADTRIPAYVNEGEMRNSLLGMAYLNRYERIEISGNTLTLVR